MDKLDYLPRDARACNVPYGGVDASRLIDSLTIVAPETSSLGTEHLVGITHKGVSPLHSLITARQEMFDNVYWHHANRACMAMLLRAVQDALLAGALAPQHLQSLDDRTLLDLLANESMPTTTRKLAESLRSRRLHKRAVEISFRATDLFQHLSSLFFDPATRRAIEMRMAESLSDLTGEPVDSDSILIDIPKPEKWRTDVWVAFVHPPVGASPVMHWRDVVGLSDDDFKRYEEHRRLIRIVAIEPLRKVVSDHWELLLLPSLGAVI
jgi:HD superfamily phosphohydrolase